MELMEQMLTEMPIEEQFMMMVQMSALLLFSSLLVSTLCGVDPMGTSVHIMVGGVTGV